MNAFKLSALFFSFFIFASALYPEQGSCFRNKVVRERTHRTVAYEVPDVTLFNQDGEEVKLKDFLASDKLIVLDFVFATCPTICPILSAGMASFQKKLGPEAEKVRLVTFTIDPDNDTPEVMKQYAGNYRARQGWTFFTGAKKDIEKVMRAFDAYVADKMDHLPLTFLHAPDQEAWTRIDGLMSTAELMEEYGRLVKQ